jgi:hypothetical protein
LCYLKAVGIALKDGVWITPPDMFETIEEFAKRVKVSRGYVERLVHECWAKGVEYIHLNQFGGNKYRIDIQKALDFLRGNPQGEPEQTEQK